MKLRLNTIAEEIMRVKNLKYLNLTNTNFNSGDLYNIPEAVQILILSKNNIEPENLLEISSRPQLKKVFAYDTVSDDELKKIKDIQTGYQQKTALFGQLSLQKFQVSRQLDGIDQAEENLRNDIIQLETDERELVKELNQKYGAGTLDPQTGTFTPAKN